MERKRLDTTLVYILSVLGFLCCCLFGSGILFSGAAWLIAQNKLKEAYADPESFENIEAMKTAKIVAIVVTAINMLMIIRVIYVFSTIGWDGFMEQYEEAIRQMN